MFTVADVLAVRAADSARVAMLEESGRSLTFGEWDRRSTAAGHGLVARGIRRGDRVGLIFPETDWIGYAIAYCAVLKAGAVAVPLSSRLAPAEVRRLLAHCGAAEVIRDIDTIHNGRTDPLAIEPHELAQILYTSGTTGQPKGVVATHANLTHGFEPRPRQRPLAHSRHFLHAFPIGTNAGQTMLFNALTAEPAALAAAGFEADRFCALIARHGVGTVFVVPAMAIELAGSLAYERHDTSSVLLLGSTAAALPPAVATALTKAFPGAVIVNYYTSTEAAPAQTTMVFDPERPGSVGHAPNPGDIRIDARPGETGEVWLRSAAPQRGYYGETDSAVFDRGWTRMGDLGYLDEDGYLYLVDRDGDVISSGAFKVSTLRVEAALYEHPAVARAAVLGLPHPVMGSMVAAAIVPRSTVDLDELRAFLGERLARHEIPTRWLTLESLPHNDGGKVLKRELRPLFTEEARGSGLASPTEVELGRIWARVLGVRRVGAEDDFFALGGDSFKAVRLATLGTKAFGVKLPVSLAFDAPVLAAQAGKIDASIGHAVAVPEPAAGPELDSPLSSLQQYFLRWMYETPEPRQVSAVHVAIRIREALDRAVLHRAVRELVHRHETLRTVFSGRTAVVLSDVEPDLVHLESTDPAGVAAAALDRPFDLERGPLTRLIDIRVGEREHVLVIAVHHLVFDGWSMGVLLRELGLVYTAFRAGRPSPLPPLALRGAGAFAWARDQWPSARQYWQRTLRGAPPALLDVPGRRDTGHYTASSLPVRLPAGLRACARRHGVTTFMALLAVWAEVLSDWAGAPDLVLMSPVPGRTRPEFEELLGCFVQSLLLRVDLTGSPTFPELLSQVRETVLAAAEHQYYPYEEFSRQIPHPAWLRFESWQQPPHLPGLESEPYELPRELMFDWPLPPGQLDLSVPELALIERPDGSMNGWLVFNRHAFDRADIEPLANALAVHAENRTRS